MSYTQNGRYITVTCFGMNMPFQGVHVPLPEDDVLVPKNVKDLVVLFYCIGYSAFDWL